MGDLVKRLRTAARKACERHNRVDQFDPAWERRPKDFIEWEAADEIEWLTNSRDAWFEEYERVNKENERLRAVVDAARPIADNYTGFAGHIELVQTLAALEVSDE